MPISVSCPCGKQFRVRDENAGKRGKCPDCGRGLLVPASQDADESNLSSGPPPSPIATTAPPSVDLYGDDEDDPNIHHRVSDFMNNISPRPPTIPSAATPPPLPKPPLVTAAMFSPTRPSIESEPWFYGFLEKYAQIGNVLGLIVLVLGMFSTAVYAGGTPGIRENTAYLIVVTIGGFLTFGLIFVGILFSGAIILLAVNVGRNLIAIRQVLQNKE